MEMLCRHYFRARWKIMIWAKEDGFLEGQTYKKKLGCTISPYSFIKKKLHFGQ